MPSRASDDDEIAQSVMLYHEAVQLLSYENHRTQEKKRQVVQNGITDPQRPSTRRQQCPFRDEK